VKLFRVFVLCTTIFAGIISCYAQSDPNTEQGTKPYDSTHGGDLDTVSLTSGGLSLHIPLVSFPQRGGTDLSFFISFSNKQWYVKPAKFDKLGHVVVPAQWEPMPDTGAQIVSSTDWWMLTSYAVEPQDPNIQGETLYDWSQSVSSPDGSTHTFASQTADTTGPQYPLRSLDATGLLRPDAQTVILSNGTRYSFPNLSDTSQTNPLALIRAGIQASSVTDANGNQINIGSTGWTDTMGRLIPGSASTSFVGIQPGVSTTDLSKCPASTSSARIWNVPGPANVNSGVRTFYFCYSIFTLSTSFDVGSSGATANYGPAGALLLSAVVLPDLTLWTFTYDNYGDLLRVGFPTGGSITYTYSMGPTIPTSEGGMSTWVTSRIVDANDGTGGHKWSYAYQAGFPTGVGTSIFGYAAKGLATVTGPDGNDTVHQIGPGTLNSGCDGYEYGVQYFEGAASGGKVLKTVQTQYDCVLPTSSVAQITDVVPVQVTTIYANGETSRTVSQYDPLVPDVNGQLVRIGSVLKQDEYDFSNKLVRSTVNHYLWQDNPAYKNNNFVSLAASVTYTDGSGNPVAKKTFGYDEVALQSSGIGVPTHLAPPAGEPYRGNLTTVSGWLDQTNSLLSSAMTYFDTGMKASNTDPLNHKTTYQYSPAFVGAYLTQTNLPDTQMPDVGAPIIHHVSSSNYDFNTGLLTGSADQNGQQYAYSYDNMLRLTESDYPDGGIVKLFYPDANTVEKQSLITGTTYTDATTKVDGLGRVYQTQILTPECASRIKVDTVYDPVGRTRSVSNPYCLTTEPTYGTTQTDYDALGRAIKITKQDGSISTTVYDDTPADSSGPTLLCTTAIDEVGKKRQSCSDAFGLLSKVIEPNPAASATHSTAWISISGSEQSATSQLATAGALTVAIQGSEGSLTTDPCANSGAQLTTGITRSCPKTVWDIGSVTLTVNGHGTSTNYGSKDTAGSVASSLAANINADASAFVTAMASGTNILLKSKVTGAASNYTLSGSSLSNDSTDFGSGSFSVTPSSAALVGGQNASITADSGSITVAVNGTPYSVSYGASDTPSSIASRLAATIGAGSYATATASGGAVTLTSTTTGAASDYSLSASYAWNSAQFVQPSFSVSSSGAAFDGGKDPNALTNNPLVTTYQYNSRNDLVCVHQKGADITPDIPCSGTTAPVVPATWRQRFFTYDSFSRLLTAMNPELNSTGNTVLSYGYDAASRVVSKHEPAPNQPWGSAATLAITYSYDALGRLLDTVYSDGTTPGTSHRYDYTTFMGHSFTNPVGREVAGIVGSASQYFMSYDAMGRIANATQCNGAVAGCKTFTATYDKASNITSIAYPANNFSILYGYDAAARLVSAIDSNGVVYAQAPTFVAGSMISEFTSPNFNSNKYHVTYNNRFQPTEVWTGTSAGAGALFDKTYFYGTSGSDNGDVLTISNVKDSTRSQHFTYDGLNRLITAGDASHWGNSYVYDAWGNLYQKTDAAPAGENMIAVPDNNNHLSTMAYDAAGNVIGDGSGHAFVFDAENRITGVPGLTYTYDAYGRRIAKSSGINYWYGPGKMPLAETDSSANWTYYIMFGGRRLAGYVPQPAPAGPDIKYFITDHLNSTGMFVDKAGTTAAIVEDNDFYPWGGRVTGLGKNTSNNTIEFTGRYRDETGLDYFGARYYSSSVGRFMSPDWSATPTNVPYSHFDDPQSLNLYSYVENRPTVLVDPDGHEEVASDTVNTTKNSDGSTTVTTVHQDESTTRWTNIGTSCNPIWVSTTTTQGTVTTETYGADGQFDSSRSSVQHTEDTVQTRNGETIFHEHRNVGPAMALNNPLPPSSGNQLVGEDFKKAVGALTAIEDPKGGFIHGSADEAAKAMDKQGVTSTKLALFSIRYDPFTVAAYGVWNFQSWALGGKPVSYDDAVNMVCNMYTNGK